MENQTKDKKRIMYVDREYSSSKDYEGVNFIRAVLERKYDIDFHFNFNERIFDYIKSSFDKRKFEALITHLPYNPSQERSPSFLPTAFYYDLYGKSLEILSKIKDFDPDLGILIYSGMDNNCSIISLVYNHGGDKIIKKTNNIQDDITKINAALDYFFNSLPEERKRRKEKMNTPPNLSLKDGKTLVDLSINLKGGLGMIANGILYEECKNSNKEVVLTNLETKISCNAKDFLKLLGLCAYEGVPMQISVQGEDKEAEKLSRRLYALLTSEDERRIDLERFI